MMKTILALVASLVAVACSPASLSPLSSSDAGLDDAEAPDATADASAAIAQTCKDFAYARCTRLQSCSSTSMQITYGTVQTCEQYFYRLCANNLEATGDSVSGYQKCTAVMLDPQQFPCDEVVYNKNPPPACRANPGPLADGSPCAVDDQCQSLWCSFPPGAACGTCGAPPKLGDPCPCGIPLICSDGACATLAELGGSCANGQVCDDGLTCVGGICVAGAATPGAACSFTGAGCDFHAGLACNAVTGTCQTLAIVGPGQACGTVQDQQQSCLAGKCIRGACVGYAPLGGACDLAAGPPCASFARCVVTTDGGTRGTCQVSGSVACP